MCSTKESSLLAVLVIAFCCMYGEAQIIDATGYRLESDPTYLIIAPKNVYPDQVVQIHVSILKLYFPVINVRGSIRKEGEEFASFTERFTEASTRLVQMQMLPNVFPGNYTLKVIGYLNNSLSGNIFENETKLEFSPKSVSMFITTTKPIYCQGQEVKFRIVPVHKNLLPAYGSMDIFVEDPTGTTVRRWLSQQTNAGILEMSIPLSDQPTFGEWNIRVRSFGYNYYKSFLVEEFYQPRLYVNVSMPWYIMEDSYALGGVITANHTSGQPVRGNGVLKLEVRLPLGQINSSVQYTWPSIEKTLSYFEGRQSFLFTLQEIKDLIGDIPKSRELHVSATINDWFLLQNRTGSAICVVYSNEVTIKLLGDRSRSFKPGFPVTVYYAVMQADGTPLRGQRRQVTITKVSDATSASSRPGEKPETKLIVPDDGIVQYKFTPSETDNLITLRAKYDIGSRGQSEVECKLSRTYTINDNFLKITTSTEFPKVNEYMVFTVRATTYVPRVYYVIAAGGNLIVSNQLEMQSTQKTFSVALSRDMVPSARIITYFVWRGEVVADALNFFVNGTSQNPVDVRINMGKNFRRDTVELTGITDPGSFIAFSGLDYDLFSYGGGTFITENDLIEEMETYDRSANGSFSHKWYYGEEKWQRVYYPAPTFAVDANTTFEYAGLIVFTDANVTRIPHNCNETLGWFPCNDGVCYETHQMCDGVMNCEDGVDEMGCEVKTNETFTPTIYRFNRSPRHYLEDATWLWKGHFVKPDGRIDLVGDVPKEPMSWVIGAFSVSRDHGLGVLYEPARHQGTRDFYIQVEMPERVVKGEQIGMRIEIFNYWIMDLECLVTLHDSDKYRFVIVEENGIVSSYKPRTSRGDVQTMVTVFAGRMNSIYMPVLPIVDGNVEVVVSATSFMGQDLVKKHVNVRYDGVTNHYHTPYLLDLINHGSMIIPDFEINVPERFVYPEQREHLYVPGSQKAALNIVGDVVGPGFFEPHLDAMNMMRMPYGGADMNMFNYASNLYTLLFLKISNRLDDQTLTKALDYMNLALQRQLSYLNKTDGSFSMFRDYTKSKPSTWVQAFVLQTLVDSDVADWILSIYMPEELLSKIAGWLVKQQNRVTGAFIERAPIYDRKYRDIPGVNEGKNISLTAHCVIALANAGRLAGSSRAAVEEALTIGVDYLEKELNDLEDPFQVSIVTYALTVANSNKRNDAFLKLDKLKRQNEFTYWSSREIPVNPTKTVNTVNFMLPRKIYDLEGYAVETTAYALLVYLRNNRLSESLPIMKWLQTMRNTKAGFASTRDSIIALQALAEYGKRDSNRDLYNVRIDIEATSTPDLKRTVDLARYNWVDNQQVQIPVVWGQVKSSAQGTGIVLMQLETNVNVEYPQQQAPTPNGTFYNIEIENIFFTGRNFSIFHMELCPKWIRPDISDKTGLTLLEVDIPTGYHIMNDDLREYVRSGEVPNLGRAAFYDQKIRFYFDYIEAGTKTCVKFRADRWYPIANQTIQNEIKVYDFYEPGMFNRSIYTTYNLFNLHICQVCGSFQCPYCPSYNSAPSLASVTSVICSIVLCLFTLWFNRNNFR